LTNSTVTSGAYTITVDAPTFSPVAGTYTGTQAVTIATITSGASIRYTTDGSTPSSTVGTVYSAPVSIAATATLKAIAYKTGLNNSTVTSGTYTIVAVAPVFSPVAGTYPATQSVTITSATSGASIRYTTDGSTPSSTVGTVYSAPVSIAATATLKAIAYKTGLTNSTVTSGTYQSARPYLRQASVRWPARTPVYRQ
jgi:kynurenine formamidase